MLFISIGEILESIIYLEDRAYRANTFFSAQQTVDLKEKNLDNFT